MGKGAPPPVSFSQIRIMTAHDTQAQQSNAAPATNAMNARNTRLRFRRQLGYRITEAMTTGTGQSCEIAPNARTLWNSTVRGSHSKQGRNAQNRTRPIGLCLGGGAPDAGFGEETMERSSCMTFAMPPNNGTHSRRAGGTRYEQKRHPGVE